MKKPLTDIWEYEAHIGTRTMNDLSCDEQNKLIQCMFASGGDVFGLVIEHDLDHAQPNALWAIIIGMSARLEKHSVIKSAFSSSPETDRNWIINSFRGTRLWLRLEEAFDPFDKAIPLTQYDWEELDSDDVREAIDSGSVEGLGIASLEDFLEPVHLDPDGIERRLAHSDFLKHWNEGKLECFVDRGLAVQAYRLSGSAWTHILPLAFLLGLIGFIPVMIFVGFWLGIGLLTLAILSRKLLTNKSDVWVRNAALSDRDRYRCFTARGVLWARLDRAV